MRVCSALLFALWVTGCGSVVVDMRFATDRQRECYMDCRQKASLCGGFATRWYYCMSDAECADICGVPYEYRSSGASQGKVCGRDRGACKNRQIEE